MKFKKKRKNFIVCIAFFLVLFIFIWQANTVVERNAYGKTFSNLDQVPHTRVGLLLGTAKYLGNGQINLYYQYRIDAAVRLLRSGKIDYVVISGDNSRTTYDEPTVMKKSLMEHGIDSTKIYLDYAGFRTFDSMVRLQKVFGQDTVVVISQKFHNERAIFIANKIKMVAYGFNAADVNRHYGMKTIIRERFARVKVILDFLWGVQPKFLGPEIPIE